ncbi:unnamed protein product [Porites evermanni]|uniref:Uncharacterized protein n=1 Tax=Porites evermanni TaxID=104178 RepID=A0ABN8PTW4_9CNID|nr:unnamed protein product [Porites evermanni]
MTVHQLFMIVDDSLRNFTVNFKVCGPCALYVMKLCFTPSITPYRKILPSFAREFSCSLKCTLSCFESALFFFSNTQLLEVLEQHLVKLKKMFFGKQFWQSLACFVIGGIITVIFIKIFEWQTGRNQELGDKRILVPVQEVGDGEREEPMEIRKFPREQDDF